MKNLKVGKKIFIGFAIVVLMMVLMSATVVTTTALIHGDAEAIKTFSALQTAINNTRDAVNLSRIQANVIYNMQNQEANESFAAYNQEAKNLIDDVVRQTQASEETRSYTTEVENFRLSYEGWSQNVMAVIVVNDHLTDLGNQGVDGADSVYQTLRTFLKTRMETNMQADQLAPYLEAMDKMTTIRQGLAHVRDTFDGSEAETIKSAIDEVITILENEAATSTNTATQQNANDALGTCTAMKELIDTFIADNDEAWTLVDATIALGDTNTKLVNTLTDALDMDMEVKINDTINLGNITIWIVLAVTLVSIAVAIVIGLIVSGLISKPLRTMSGFLEYAGTTGDINIGPDIQAKIEKISSSKDEIGHMSTALAGFFMRITDVSKVLEAVAEGNLTVELPLLSENDVMGNSMHKMLGNLNDVLHDLRIASVQVSSGAQQISMSAQNLASGSSEQAASVEEFSAILAGLQEKTNSNAGNSQKAQMVNTETGASLEGSIHSMEEMLVAMKEIDESSGNITKIIKVIDDIAFQTNILALNAAVEAAQAGPHGKGFAVVADEVRNLAAKSAQAAKETSMLIAESSQRVKMGNRIVTKTNTDLAAAAENARLSTSLVGTVTVDSNEQAISINNVTVGIEQISSVVQANSALAEEAAAAAEEMSAQSVLLDEIVARFILKNDKLTTSQGGMLPDMQNHSYESGSASQGVSEAFPGEDHFKW